MDLGPPGQSRMMSTQDPYLNYISKNSFQKKKSHIHRFQRLRCGHIFLEPPFYPLRRLRKKTVGVGGSVRQAVWDKEVRLSELKVHPWRSEWGAFQIRERTGGKVSPPLLPHCTLNTKPVSASWPFTVPSAWNSLPKICCRVAETYHALLPMPLDPALPSASGAVDASVSSDSFCVCSIVPQAPSLSFLLVLRAASDSAGAAQLGSKHRSVRSSRPRVWSRLINTPYPSSGPSARYFTHLCLLPWEWSQGLSWLHISMYHQLTWLLCALVISTTLHNSGIKIPIFFLSDIISVLFNLCYFEIS